MASVQDVFAQMQADQAEVLADEAFTPDPEEYCTLESDATRRILIPQKYAVFGVESDDKTNRIKFAFPKAVNDIQDLSQYNLRFNYIDAKGNADQITARNMKVQGDYVLFDWILTRNVTRYQGNISFIVCAVTVKEDGVISNEWNTTIATAQSLEGIETEPTPGEERIARDLLTELLVSLNNSKNDAIAEITQTKTQAISDVETEGQTQTNAVDAKGAQVLESIPDDYTTLENRVDELERNRAYVIVGNGSGEFVTLNDSSELKTRNVKLFGKSVQAETTGAQLFNVNICKNETDLQYKITIDDYATGKITVSMDNPAGTVVMPVNRLSDYCPTMTAGKTYYLSGKRDGSSNGNIRLVDVSDTWGFGTSRGITEQDLQSAVQFGFGTYSNIMIVEGSTEKPYEVYTGGEAATEPTPDYPLPITSAGIYDAEEEKYEIGTNVDGANLLDYDDWKGTGITRGTGDYKDYGVVLVATENDCFTNYSSEDYKILVSPDTEYCLSWEHSGGSGNVYVFENGITTSGYGHFVSAIDKKLVFKTRNDTTFIRFRVGVMNSGDTATYKNIQLNVGDTPLEFRPFQGTQQKVLQLPNPFRGIPVDSGGNYTDADGQQWICDYIDRERGKYVQCVQEIVLDGSEDEKWNLFENYNGFGGSLANGGKAEPNRLICNIAPYSSEPPADLSEFAITTNYLYGDYLYLVNIIDLINVSTVDNFRIWLSKNPVKVIYILNIPIEIDLTSDQLAALNLSTYQGITNIGTDTMPQVGIDVEYIADTKTYIDNAIAEAIAAIPTEQGGNEL